jgi:hypothetical protein
MGGIKYLLGFAFAIFGFARRGSGTDFPRLGSELDSCDPGGFL